MCNIWTHYLSWKCQILGSWSVGLVKILCQCCSTDLMIATIISSTYLSPFSPLDTLANSLAFKLNDFRHRHNTLTLIHTRTQPSVLSVCQCQFPVTVWTIHRKLRVMRSNPCSLLCGCSSNSDESHPKDGVDKRDEEWDDDERKTRPCVSCCYFKLLLHSHRASLSQRMHSCE